MNKKKLIKWLMLLVWMLVIFLFSNQPHSGETTKSIIEQIMPNIKTNSLLDMINFIVRKSAHITEYFILALLTISLLKEYTKKQSVILVSSLIFCFIYALTDEFHQSFIPGRSSLFRDILIDTSGSVLSLVSYYLYQKKFTTKKL
ncbi:MAG: VanZ family protein [Bacilli bacterium]